MEISLRHREWGFDCPAVDIDFLLLEYDEGKPKGLVEYKNELAKLHHSKHPTLKAIEHLADASSIPFFVCRYSSNFMWWEAFPINLIAFNFVEEPTKFTERQWVELLYKIRGKEMPENLFDVFDL